MTKCTYIMYFRSQLGHNERLTCARTRPMDNFAVVCHNGIKLQRVTHTRFLGVLIDEKLNWDEQLIQIENKLKSSIVVIKRIKNYIPKGQYRMIYHTLFLSHLTYCISAWGGVSPHRLSKIFSTQKCCLRILFGEKASFDHPGYYETCARVRSYLEHMNRNYCLEHTKPLFAKHGFFTVHNLYNLHTLTETFKIIKYHTPIALYDFFTFNSQSHHLLRPPKIKLVIAKHNFSFQACNLWNNSIKKILIKPNLDQNNILIPGSCANSDTSTSIGFYKHMLKKLLLKIQNNGDTLTWYDFNFKLT